MPSYQARYVHKISPSPKDVHASPVKIELADLANRATLGAALRKAGVLPHGGSLRSYRIEGDRVIAFPNKSVWHSIILSL